MSLVKARLRSELDEEMEVMFNPNELTVNKAAEWKASRAKGKNTPKLRFQSGKSGTLNLKLHFDTTHSGETVTWYTDKILDFMSVNSGATGADRSRNMGRPPWVRFQWGDFASFKAVIEKAQFKYTYFTDAGTPLRAIATLALKQYEDEKAWAAQNPTSGTPVPHRMHRVQPGESLDRIAALHYSDATRWRDIADANVISDPLTLEVGSDLAIPEREPVNRA